MKLAGKRIHQLDTVALLADLPQHNLLRGGVDTVVELLVPDSYEGEFSDDEGQTYAQFAVASERLIVLHNQGAALKIAT